ncbi:MAG TPA: hypothetical protein VFJ19_07415 [Nocardioidaceae bacterium]|nr:hypothetical protein [Nocardioidaceae bacterium]
MGTTVGGSAPARNRRPHRVGRIGRLGTAVVAVATVAALGVLAGTVPSSDRTAMTAAGASHHRAAGVVDLDGHPARGRKAVESCLTRGFASKRGQVRVLYGVWQRFGERMHPTLILRNRQGQIRLCDAFGSDNPSRLPLRHATSHTPVKFLSGGRKDWNCRGSHLRRFTMTEWLTVDRSVRTVMLRLKVGQRVGPWFVTHPRHGYAHVQAWIGHAGRQRVVVQQRVLDNRGHDVNQHRLPARYTLPGCSGGGSVQIL